MPSGTTARAAAALACALLLAPAPAAAQDRSSKHSAAEIRNAYPLQVQPRHKAQAPARTPVVTPRPVAQKTGSGFSIPLYALLAVAAFGAGFVVTVRPFRLRRAPEPAPELTLERAAEGLPPAPHRRWTAEVRWQQDGEACVFAVVARTALGSHSAVIATSQPIEWPPVGAAALERVAAAAKELETSLVSAGWQPLPPGDAWYAKRFAWEPASRAERFDRRPQRSRAIARRNGAS